MMAPLILYYDMVKAALSVLIEKSIGAGSWSPDASCRFDYDVMRSTGVHLEYLDNLAEEKRSAFLPRLLIAATALTILFEPDLLHASLRFPYAERSTEDFLAKLSSMDSTARMEFFALLDDSRGRDRTDSGERLEPRASQNLFELLSRQDYNSQDSGPWKLAFPSGMPFFQHHALSVYKYASKPLKWLDDLRLVSVGMSVPPHGQCPASIIYKGRTDVLLSSSAIYPPLVLAEAGLAE